MTDDDFRMTGLPASLAGADPFAAQAQPRTHHSSAGGTTPTSTGGPHGAGGGSPAPATNAGLDQTVPCPCSCECGNDTGKTYSDVESLAATQYLRCHPCGEAMHHGPQWNTQSTTMPEARMGPSDTVTVGKHAGTTITIRKPHVDNEDEEWNKKIAHDLAAERRDAAITKWQTSLPERWQMPYEDGEELLPEVTQRLERFRSGKGDHATSLLCIGPFGSGKTWVAYTYARAAVDQWLLWPQEIRVGTESELMEPIALASPWEIAKESSALLRPNLKMLVIDDVGTLGTYKNLETRHAVFAKVINWMYEHKRALVITTNLVPGQGESLDKWIGPTAYERLRHMVGKDLVFREEAKRTELTAKWEAEYQSSLERVGTHG